MEARSTNSAIRRTNTIMATSSTSNQSDEVSFKRDRRINSSLRRQLLLLSPLSLILPSSPAVARNLPVSTGADTSRIGTRSTLLPLVTMRTNIALIRQTLQEQGRNEVIPLDDVMVKTKTELTLKPSSKNKDNNNDDSAITIPTREEEFKRYFDAYSDQVSYKQKFLDQNAFLVYYTNGFDGPGRDKLEKDPVNERQTLQFGARNEAWISLDNFLSEFDFYSTTTSTSRSTSNDSQESIDDMIKYLSDTIQAMDRYLNLAPVEDVEAVQ
jgi:hypothetical protein